MPNITKWQILAALLLVGIAGASFAAWSQRSAFANGSQRSLVATVAASSSDDGAAQVAFERAYPVFVSPRCQNCHPSGDAPLQGDDSHVHAQNVKRGADEIGRAHV